MSGSKFFTLRFFEHELHEFNEFDEFMYQHIPIRDRYEIFREKCRDEGIEPPTFEEYRRRHNGY